MASYIFPFLTIPYLIRVIGIEFYGLFAVTGRTSSFIGPTVYGFLAYEAAIYFQKQGHLVLAAEQLGQRVAIGSIIIFLLAGLFILLGVNDPTKKYIES